MSSPLDEIEGCTSVKLDAVATGAQEGLCEARTSEEGVAAAGAEGTPRSRIVLVVDVLVLTYYCTI